MKDRRPTEDHMTMKQLEMVKDFENNLEYTYLKCWLKSQRFGNDIVSMPATAHTGEPVQHRANMVMHEISEYYYQRAKLVEGFLDRDVVNRIKGEVRDTIRAEYPETQPEALGGGRKA